MRISRYFRCSVRVARNGRTFFFVTHDAHLLCLTYGAGMMIRIPPTGHTHWKNVTVGGYCAESFEILNGQQRFSNELQFLIVAFGSSRGSHCDHLRLTPQRPRPMTPHPADQATRETVRRGEAQMIAMLLLFRAEHVVRGHHDRAVNQSGDRPHQPRGFPTAQE